MTGTRGDTAGTPDPQGGEVAGRWNAAPTTTADARTPEELETLLEDALVVRDGRALAGLFEERAVLVAGDGPPALGREEIAQLALATWDGDHTYVADPRRVVHARDIALVVAEKCINVVRRGRDGAWRFVIVRLLISDGTGRREQ